MSHKRRFYTPLTLSKKNEILIEGEEAHHALKVLRIKEGEGVEIINGKGEEVKGIIQKIEKEKLEVLFQEEVKIFSEPKIKISLLIGMSEISSLEEALMHTTELGLWKFSPVYTKYSLTKPEQIKKKMERFKRIAISAIKQSGVHFLPQIEIFHNLKDALKNLPKQIFLFSQDAQKYINDFDLEESELTFAIGPEGDFSEEEKELFEKFGCKKAKICPNTLRVETAAISALAQIKLSEKRAF